MPTVHPLPDHPNLDSLRQQARALQRAVRAGDPDAAARVELQHPGGVAGDPAAFRLSTAQLVVAREYGFGSWPRLRQYLELLADGGWDSSPPGGPEDPADQLCRLACLTYSDDGRDRWAQARRLLADHPDLPGHHIWAAAAATEPAAVRRLLAADPTRARRRGGPYRWAPLCYLAYSRLDPDIPAEPVLTVARLLLGAGADPNEGYLLGPCPFTLLTGVFGEGEAGPERQPRHPHSLALAGLLLDAGANPNDYQALYNRMFTPGNDHLELLFEYGLGTGETYPWRARMGDRIDSPAGLLRYQLRWAIEHDFLDRVRLLLRHGVDIDSPYLDGATPAELAARNGSPDTVELLVSHGGAPLRLDPVSAFIGAVLGADRAAVERLSAAHPGVVDDVRRARPGLIVWAAAQGRTGAVALLAELGFDVNALGRGDTPVEQEWETALHHAAWHGNLGLARLLLSLGADPNIPDCRFGATPLGWAQHFERESTIELLTPLTDTDHD